MDILRIITAGSVDDGKSTLIGRLLYDSNSIKSDVVKSLVSGTTTEINLAHVTDGLRSERENGITIDVAYKYFTTHERKYILVDAPGHFQYTKNLISGASLVDAMIVLIDATMGVLDQTRRHTIVASFLRVPKVIVVINKMDLVGYSETVFREIIEVFSPLALSKQINDIAYIPVSALNGDNVIKVSTAMPWYNGETLLECLERCNPDTSLNHSFRFPVQLVYAKNDQTALFGRVSSGVIGIGETIKFGLSQTIGKIHRITVAGNDCTTAYAGQSAALFVDVSSAVRRGDVVCEIGSCVECSRQILVELCWLDERPFGNGRFLLLMNGSCEMCTVIRVDTRSYYDRYNFIENTDVIQMNEFFTAVVSVDNDVCFDKFIDHKGTGRGILVDIKSYETCAAVVVK